MYVCKSSHVCITVYLILYVCRNPVSPAYVNVGPVLALTLIEALNGYSFVWKTIFWSVESRKSEEVLTEIERLNGYYSFVWNTIFWSVESRKSEEVLT